MNYNINKRPTLLDLGDRVTFELKGETLEYQVQNGHLDHMRGTNSYVFDLLDLDKESLAAAAYGYNPGAGLWPCSNDRDFAALTRLVNSLFERIAALPEAERKGATSKPKAYTIDNRPSCLKVDDEVVFVVQGQEMKHHANSTRLTYFSGPDSSIFDKLGVDKVAFCREAFGYKPRGLCFPEAREGDMAALTRLANAIFDKLAAMARFKAGDRVRLTDDENAPCQDVGAMGTVQKDDGSEEGCRPYLVKWGDRDSDYVNGCEIELAGFRVGDKVRVKANVETPKACWGRVRHDHVGTVVKLSSPYPGCDMTVDFPEQVGWAALASEMELVEAAPAKQQPKPAFLASSEDADAQPEHVTEIYLEQDGDDVNICARRNGTTHVIAFIRPDEDEGGKGRLHRWPAELEELQLVQDDDAVGMIAMGEED